MTLTHWLYGVVGNEFDKVFFFDAFSSAILDTQGDCMQVFSGHSGPVTCGGFSSDGKFVVTASVDGTAKVWNPKNGKCRHSFGNVRLTDSRCLVLEQ